MNHCRTQNSAKAIPAPFLNKQQQNGAGNDKGKKKKVEWAGRKEGKENLLVSSIRVP